MVVSVEITQTFNVLFLQYLPTNKQTLQVRMLVPILAFIVINRS